MATSGNAFAISLGIYGATFLGIILLFSILRIFRGTRRFYAPRKYHAGSSLAFRSGGGFNAPPLPSPPLGSSFLGWVTSILRFSEADVLHYAGVDAAMYLEILRFGLVLFSLLTLLCCATALPINLTGGYLNYLSPGGSPYAPDAVSPYTFWINASDASAQQAQQGKDQSSSNNNKPDTVKAPKIYNESIADPPPGILWWQYLPDVPPLPDIVTVLGPQYERYDWRYDDQYSTVKYVFTDLDKTTMANVAPKSTRLYGHAVLAWVVSIIVMWRLWKTCNVAMRLRQYHLLTVPPGSESHTVLVTDVPGVPHGTVVNRLSGTMLSLLPVAIRKKAMAQVTALKRTPTSIMKRMMPEGMHLASSSIGTSSRDRRAVQPFVTRQGDVLGNKQQFENQSRNGRIQVDARGQESLNYPLPGAQEEEQEEAEEFLGSTITACVHVVVPSPHAEHAEHHDERVRVHAHVDRWSEAVAQLNAGLSVPEMVEAQFQRIYGNDVAGVEVVRATAELDGLVATYAGVKSAAADAIDASIARYQAGKTPKPMKKLVVGPKLGDWGRQRYGVKPRKVDAFEFYRDRLEQLRGAIHEAQTAAAAVAYPSAFVTFGSRRSQVVAAGALMSEDLSTWRCQAAPRPDEVLWRNLRLRHWERAVRVALMWVAFFLLVAFFMIPVSALQALLSTNSLVDFIQRIPIVNSIVTAIIPGLALVIFLAALPPILRLMRTVAGDVSTSQVDRGVVSWFFVFQVITVFFGSFIAGTFANQFQQLISDPGSIITILGTAAPQAAIFFMTFLVAQALLTTPLSLIRPWGLVLFLVRRPMAVTSRAKARLRESASMGMLYGTVVPADTIAVLLGVTFCLISPIIAPLALLYFMTSYLVSKYNLIMVAKERFQSGGLLWMQTFNQLITGLIIFQVIMVALLGIKKAPAPSLMVLPLPFISLIFVYVVHATFWPPMQTLSMLTAVERDAEEDQETTTPGMRPPTVASNPYLAPSFKIDDAEHAELIAQCEVLRQAQADGDYSRLEEFAADISEDKSDRGGSSRIDSRTEIVRAMAEEP